MNSVAADWITVVQDVDVVEFVLDWAEIPSNWDCHSREHI